MYVCKSEFAYFCLWLRYLPAHAVYLSVCMCTTVYLYTDCTCMYVYSSDVVRLGVCSISLCPSLCVSAHEEFTVDAFPGEISLCFSSRITEMLCNLQ